MRAEHEQSSKKPEDPGQPEDPPGGPPEDPPGGPP